MRLNHSITGPAEGLTVLMVHVLFGQGRNLGAVARRLAERRAALGALAAGAGWHFAAHDTARPAADSLLWLSRVLAA